MTARGFRDGVSSWSDANVLASGVMGPQLCDHTKNHGIMHFKGMHL